MIHARALRLQPQWCFAQWVFAGMSYAMFLAFAATIILWILDARTIEGVSVWAKPLKFELALAIHAGTLALVVSRLGRSPQTGIFLQGVAGAFLAACTIEMGWIILQAAQGQQSHFNDSTAFHRAMFSVMAFAAIIITGTAAAVATAVWRDRDFAAGGALRVAILIGLVGGTILTLVTAFTIGARGSPYVGGVPSLADRMMFTGWSLTGGDLRVSHFLSTHMMQAIPIAALFAIKVRPGLSARIVVLGVAALWVVWTLMEFGAALSGEPALLLALWF